MTNATNRRHILVVDDEAPVRALLRDCFELDGFAVCEAETGTAAVAALNSQQIDLVTLDLKLGGENGLEIARTIRSVHNVPIVMITGRGDTIDRIVGLELGADDYIAKPFHVREVQARIRAVLRRYGTVLPAAALANAPPPTGTSSSQRLQFEDWTLDVDRRELRDAKGDVHDLTTAEYNMLVMFLERPHRVLSRDNIMDNLKGHEWSPFDRSIDALIVRLRRKIEAQPNTPRLIKTVRGVGYVFTVDVHKA